ncbi:MAG: transporter [Alphaproteobacteria bacterium]|nr:transporter [Alphaproteobacteria bacterium]
MERRIGAAALAGMIALAGTSGALAQTTPAPSMTDALAYTFFNPVPDSAMRSFNTDRPTKSNVPFTVDAGHVQYEMDLFNYARQVSGTTRMDTWLAPNPTLKVGITNNADLELNIAPFASVRTFDSATGRSSTVTGTGDLFARMKINLWGNNGGQTSFALIPYVKAPTAPVGIGNGAVEGGVIAPLSISLPNDFTLLFNSEVDALKNNVSTGYHPNFTNLVNLSRPIVKDVTLYVELWSSINEDPLRTVRQVSFDTAVQWTVRPNFAIDAGVNLGLNRDTPAMQVYAGVSQRF